MNLRLLSILLVSILLLTVIVTAIPVRAEGVVLRVLTRHDTTIQREAKNAFLKSDLAKKYGVTDIIFYSALPENWRTVIDSMAARGQNIDIGWGGGPTLFDELMSIGYLEPLTDPELLQLVESELPDSIGGVPTKRFQDGQLMWVAAAISSFGFTVNTELLERYGLPTPKHWADLANETYALRLPAEPLVGMADAPRSTSNTRMYQIMLQAYGWDEGWQIITLMGANARIYDASDAVREAVIRGEIAIGLTIDFYGYTAEYLTNGKARYIIPEGESIVNGDPIAVIKGTKNKEAAEAFIRWVLSVEGQKVWLNPEINRLPINPKVFDTPEGQERQDLKSAYERAVENIGIQFDDELARSVVHSLRQFFTSTITEAQQELREAWVELVRAKYEGRINQAQFKEFIRKLASPLELKFEDPETDETVSFTLEYAQSINDKFKDPQFTSTIKERWKEAARQRYLSVLETVKTITAPPETSPTTTTTTTTTPTTGATTPSPTTSTPPQTSPTTTPPPPPGPGPQTLWLVVAVIVIIIVAAAVALRARRGS